MKAQRAAALGASRLDGRDSPRIDAELLLCHLLGVDRHEIITLDRELTEPEVRAYLRLVDDRAAGVPLQHILGEWEFLGRSFHVGPQALVPRPETETLFETFAELLPADPRLLLDLGTGSGIMAISAALAWPRATVIATDIDRSALALAARNVSRHGAANIRLCCGDMIAHLSAGTLFDGIVANLPYICSGDIPQLQEEVRRGDPRISLDGGPDGLRFFRRIAASAPSLLAEGGILALEIGEDQAGAVASILESDGMSNPSIFEDLAGRPRVIVYRKRT